MRAITKTPTASSQRSAVTNCGTSRSIKRRRHRRSADAEPSPQDAQDETLCDDDSVEEAIGRSDRLQNAEVTRLLDCGRVGRQRDYCAANDEADRDEDADDGQKGVVDLAVEALGEVLAGARLRPGHRGPNQPV